ncbi:MAG: hypothetical protein HY080_15985 [Gammaproteobacteria bacterium]|nr:hypothetical protein [Gammaproteobacteria bacterium]
MRYKNDGTEITLGDSVLVEGNVHGIVVCNVDTWQCLEGYESWLTREELVGGGKLSSGVMIKTDELGFLYYAENDEDILKFEK